MKKIVLILVLIFCVIVGIALTACKKNAPVDTESSKEQEQDEKAQESVEGVTVIIRDEEDTISGEGNTQEELEDEWDDVELDFSGETSDTQKDLQEDGTTNNTVTPDESEDTSSSEDEGEKELPEYYPGAY